MAAQRELDLACIKGTGPGGLIVKADLPAETENGAPFPQSPAEANDGDTIMPFAGIRKTIADNLMLSKRSAADVTTVADVCMDQVKEFRSILPVSYTTFVVLAASRALAEYPMLNALVEEKRIIMKKDVNINVAVATASGLMTPVISNASRKNLLTMAQELADLSERGRAGRLTVEDFAGGTFTVTNSGVFGSVLFTPIINHPQSAVLGMGRIALTPVVRAGSVVPALMMYLSLTYNHRSVDGETGVTFLQRVRHYLEHPLEMITV
ncbi:MAG: 2-oxo acid dehydrogenase subunit E2 [Deltaproteobacteria bacterium]|nr:2-oxo acid dehydrogenase subunit E2 [Deltaproteobacteria bacterium]